MWARVRVRVRVYHDPNPFEIYQKILRCVG